MVRAFEWLFSCTALMQNLLSSHVSFLGSFERIPIRSQIMEIHFQRENFLRLPYLHDVIYKNASLTKIQKIVPKV